MKHGQSIQSWSVLVCSVLSILFHSCLHAVFLHIHALSLVGPFVECNEHPGGKMALHICLNAQQKLTSKLCTFRILQHLSNKHPFKFFFEKRGSLSSTATIVMKHNCASWHTRKTSRRTVPKPQESELLEPPREQIGTA